MRYQRVLLACLVGSAPLIGATQTFNLSNGGESSCSGTLYDSGGSGANYGNNQNLTFTLCPDQPGAAVILQFTQFGLGAGDNIALYDGNTITAAQLGTYIGTDLQGQTVQASPLNSSGCITIVFISDGSGTGNFAATISCYQPCDRPTASAVMGELSPALICPGETVQFNGSSSTAAPGFSVTSWTWDFGDGTTGTGTTASHGYSTPGAYVVQLHVVDNNGCSSTNSVDLLVMAGTEPTFNGTGGTLSVCPGGTACLTGEVQATSWNTLPEANLGGGVTLPDGSGVCYNTSLNFTQFTPGQTLTNANQLPSVCASLEHSYMGDLVISLICPNGQSMIFHQQGGAATYLGAANDNDAAGAPVLGACWNYCWSPTATLGTFANSAAFGATPNVVNAGTPASAALIPGTYSSVQPWTNLVGCPLNGDWTFRICDNLLIDNGFICDWAINFDPSLFPDAVSFTPVYGADADSSFWSGPHITSLSADADQVCVSPPTPGTYDYIYTVTDNFGCTYDTTITVTVTPGPVVDAGPDQVTCGTPLQLGATMVSGGQPGSCVYQLQLIDSWGDGWNGGASITVTINGVSNTYTLPTGTGTTINLPVTHGDPIVLTYQAGTIWNGENSFRLRNSAGTIVYSSPTGPGTGVAWSGTAACPVEAFTFSWSPTGGLSNPNVANPTATVSSTTTYCVTAIQPSHPECPATDCMTITVDSGIDAGIGSSLTLCQDGPATDLFTLLGGTPDLGGAWTTPAGLPHSGLLQPGSDASGAYTYTVTGTGACGAASASAQVTVTINLLPSAGGDGNLTVCNTGPGQALFASLSGAPTSGGTWTSPGGMPHSGTFTPGVDADGGYTYTVVGAAPCPSAQAIVVVQTNIQPSAGSDGALTACPTGAAIMLSGLLNGNPAAGGSWTGPTGTPHNGTFDPSVDQTGAYTYTVTATAPCTNATGQVVVSLAAEAEPGSDGILTLCETSAATDLFTSLTGAPAAGGTWTSPGGTPHSGVFTPGVDADGGYTYTVQGQPPCPSAQAIVVVQTNVQPTAGSNGSVTVCPTGAAIALSGQLNGSPAAGGSWTTPTGAPHSGTFDPASDQAGAYTYTVTAAAPCTDATAQVIVSLGAEAEPGGDGTLTLCVSSAATDLFTSLTGTPTAGGTWTSPGGTPHSGTFTPGIDTDGGYTYTVQGQAPCPSGSASVTVTVMNEPDAGQDGTVTLCTTNSPVDLFGMLGGSPGAGGTWTGPTGSAFSGPLDPAVHPPGDYTYQIIAPPPCTSDAAIVSVSIVAPADPGSPASIILCESDGPIALFAELGGVPEAGGSWTTPAGLPFGGVFDPAVHTVGGYTYTVQSTMPCTAVSATLTVVVSNLANAGTDGTLTLCNTSTSENLFGLLGSADPGGSWTDPSGNAFGGSYDPAQHAPGTYTYTINASQPCPVDQATINVALVTVADAGSNGNVALCSTSATTPLFDHLGGAPDAGGQWLTPAGGPFTGSFVPGSNAAGTYMYVQMAPAPCVNDTAFVAVSVAMHPDPGTDGSLLLCATAGNADLMEALGGSPQAGGIWTGPAGPADGNFIPGTDLPGAYTYQLNGTAPCPNESATVTVSVEQPGNAGTNGTLALCPEAAATDLFGQLGGTPAIGGTWTGPGGIASDNMYDPATEPQGTYTYTVAGGSACPNATATVAVTIHSVPQPNAGPDAVSCTLDYTLGATGSWTSGFWSGPAGLAFSSASQPNATISSATSGTYTLVWTTLSDQGCQASDEVTIVLTTPMAITTGSTDALCHGQCNGTANATASGGNVGASGYAYTWTGAGGQGGPAVAGLCAGSYTVQATDMNGCSVQTALTIAQPLPIVAEVTSATGATCPGYCDGAVVISGPSGAVFALAGSGIFQAEGVFADLCGGNHLFTVRDTAGCEGSVVAHVTNPPPVSVSFGAGPDTVFVSSPVVHFINGSSPSTTTYLWDFGGLGTSTAQHPSFIFPGELGAEHTVCLTAWDANGCEGQYCAPVWVLDEMDVFVPNAFSPDGDEFNEVFLPVFNVTWVVDYEFMIFNRWGERIFSTTDPGQGWRGDASGTAVQQDVYVWRLQCRDKYRNTAITRTGHVTLLR